MNSTITKPKKTSKGRQKIEIKKVESAKSRMVTRSKRRVGLFNKAAELCVMTGADVAVMVRYSGGRTYAFGHPSVDAVVEGREPADPAETERLVREFRERYDDVANEVAEEKRRGEMIVEANAGNNCGYWWDEPIDSLGLNELEAYVAAVEELKKKVTRKADEKFMKDSNSTSFSSMLAMDPNNENSSEFANYHFINQGFDSTSNDLLVSYGYDFGHDAHAPLGPVSM